MGLYELKEDWNLARTNLKKIYDWSIKVAPSNQALILDYCNGIDKELLKRCKFIDVDENLKKGRKSKITDEVKNQIKLLYEGKLSLTKIALECKVSRNTVREIVNPSAKDYINKINSYTSNIEFDYLKDLKSFLDIDVDKFSNYEINIADVVEIVPDKLEVIEEIKKKANCKRLSF